MNTGNICKGFIMSRICLESIATVFTSYNNPKDLVFACEQGLNTITSSKIVIKEKYAEGLTGIENFSHLFVIFHLDRVDRTELTTHPGPASVKGLPRVGIFASRSQYRPNPIALRLVKLLRVDGNVLYVEGLDAINLSQVLDIKPYVKGFDRPRVYSNAPWYDWLEA
jgi:tRNA (adenine37-N6)-methyltransferase